MLLLPTAFTIIWFVAFGLSAIDVDLHRDGELSAAVTGDVGNIQRALFMFLENFPAAGVMSGLAILIVVVFLTTSSDSASFVIDMLSSSDVTSDPPARQRVFWAISEGVVAATPLAAGGLAALQDVITVLGLPFFALGLVVIYSLLRGLRTDPSAHTLRHRPQAGR